MQRACLGARYQAPASVGMRFSCFRKWLGARLVMRSRGFCASSCSINFACLPQHEGAATASASPQTCFPRVLQPAALPPHSHNPSLLMHTFGPRAMLSLQCQHTACPALASWPPMGEFTKPSTPTNSCSSSIVHAYHSAHSVQVTGMGSDLIAQLRRLQVLHDLVKRLLALKRADERLDRIADVARAVQLRAHRS